MPSETLLFIISLCFGLYMTWNIGANDVANAMGTSVGSGALTLKKAVLIAAVLEFCGAFFFGSNVTETLQKGIIDPTLYASEPLILVIGMLSALLGTGIWLQLSTFYGWPVSTTHTIIGSIVGFGLITGGKGIQWNEIGFIALSWVLSPLMGAILSYIIFSIIQKKILYSKDPLASTKKIAPFFVFFSFFILFLAVTFDGLKSLHLDIPFPLAFCISLACSLFATVLSLFIPKLLAKYKRSISLNREELELHHETFFQVEKVFGYLQILSACFVAFSHGANDVANAIGPLAAIVTILKTHTVVMHAEVPAWMLALGGGGIVAGLATWGWRVIQTVGKKITDLTPSRGFSAEIAAATTILIATKLGLPISTTHTLVGAILGVGLARGIGALNLRILSDIAAAWLVTIPAGAIFTIIIFFCLKNLIL